MANVVLRIETNPNASEEMFGTITNYNSADVGTNDNVSNTSIKANENGVYSGIENASGEGSNGLTWADDYLVFNDQDNVDNVENTMGYVESEANPTQFIWGIVPESKEYYIKLTFSNATNLKDITIIGDSLNKQFPTRAILDGTKEVFSNDYNWSISFENESDTHTIEFTNWNKANYNAVISQIRVMLRFVNFDKKELKSVESLSQTQSDASEIFYGVLPNTGDVKLIDTHEEIYDLLTEGSFFKTTLPCHILIDNNQIQSHVINNLEYSKGDKSINLYLGDKLSDLNNINIAPEKTTTLNVNASKKCLRDVLAFYLAKAGFISDQYDFEKLEEAMKSKVFIDTTDVFGSETFFPSYYESLYEYISKIDIIDFSYYVKSINIHDVLDNICKATQMILFQKNDGKIKFISARPKIFDNEKVLCIPAKRQISRMTEDVLLRNKYDDVSFSYKNQEISKGIISETNYTLKGNDGVWSLIQIPDAEVKEINGGKYLCFFETISGSGDFITSNLYLEDDSIYSAVLETKGTLGSVIHAPFILSEANNVTKQMYSFTDNEGNPRTIIRLPYYSTLTSETYAICIPLDGESNESLSVKIYGRKSETTKQDRRYLNLGNNIYNFQYDNEFISNKLRYFYKANSNMEMYELLFTHIVNDYKDGLRSAKISISCGNLYDLNGNISKDWDNNKDVIEIGDLVRVDKDNDGNSISKYKDGSPIFWRVVGRAFRKTGVPLIDLELQEVKKSGFSIPLINLSFSSSISNLVKEIIVTRESTDTNEKTGQIAYSSYSIPEDVVLYANDKIRINIIPRYADHKVKSISINGESYNNGEEYVVPEKVAYNELNVFATIS